MAVRRITKSSIDWKAFAERVPTDQQHSLLAFKTKSVGYLSKVMALPEKPPKLDFALYRARLGTEFVDKFEKGYGSVNIPYPIDTLAASIDAQEKENDKEVELFVKRSMALVAAYKVELNKWHNMVPMEELTMEDYKDYFPDRAYDDINRPTLWPHTAEDQPGYKPADEIEKAPAH